MNSGPIGSLIGLLQDEVDLSHCGAVDLPADNITDRCKLIGPARAP